MKQALFKPAQYGPQANQTSGGHCRDRHVVAMSVRMARAALGWSQAELGRLLGMSQRAIHRIEQGHSMPRRTTLLAIEALLAKAGLKIEACGDGGFRISVPASMLEDLDSPPNVAAPGLSDFPPLSEEDEAGEAATEETLP
jgi:transcriptional regulator with XRE-family HTH domain